MNVFWKRFFRSEWFLLVAWFGLFVSVFIIVRIAANVMLYQSVKRARSCGVELDYKKFIPPQIPPKENASYVIEDAVNAILDYNDSLLSESDPYAAKIQEIIDRNGPFQFSPENDLDIFRDAIRPYKVGIDVLFEGRSLKNARFDVDYDKPYQDRSIYPDTSIRLKLANVLYASTLVHLHDGDVDRACDTLDLLFRYSLWCFRETPSIFSKLTGFRVAERGFGALRLLQQSAVLPKPIRENLLINIAAIRSEATADFGLRYNTVECDRIISNSLSLGTSFTTKREKDRGVVMTNLVRVLMGAYFIVDESYFIDYSTTMLSQIDGTAYERKEFRDVREDIPSWVALTQMNAMDYRQVLLRRDVLRTLVDLVLLSFAVEGRKEKDGALPESIDSLVDGTEVLNALDPFSGELYLYRKTESGFSVYSVGPDFDDDGGVMNGAYLDSTFDGDIAWPTVVRDTDSNG